jgi:flagellar motor switch protein FliN/FliY
MNDDKEKLDLDDLTGIDASDAGGTAGSSEAANDGFSAGSFHNEDDCPVEQLGAIYDVPVQVSAVLGKTTMPISQLIRLGRGAILELDRKVGESIDVVVNNRLVARGEVVIVDERIGITMTEIIKSDA